MLALRIADRDELGEAAPAEAELDYELDDDCEHDRARTLVWVPHACISRIHMPCVRTLDALFRERETWNHNDRSETGAPRAPDRVEAMKSRK